MKLIVSSDVSAKTNNATKNFSIHEEKCANGSIYKVLVQNSYLAGFTDLGMAYNLYEKEIRKFQQETFEDDY